MSRASRFDKLESERTEKDGERSPALEERFGAEPTPASPVETAEPPAPPSPLVRFEADGAQHLSLDTDELMRLPFRRCAECQMDSSKYDRRCIACGASLETPAARELNLALLADFDTRRAQEAAQLAEQHEAGIRQRVEDEFKRQEEALALEQAQRSVHWRAWLWGGAAVCFLVAVWARSFCFSGGLFILGVALVVATLPASVLKVLAGPGNRWRRF